MQTRNKKLYSNSNLTNMVPHHTVWYLISWNGGASLFWSTTSISVFRIFHGCCQNKKSLVDLKILLKASRLSLQLNCPWTSNAANIFSLWCIAYSSQLKQHLTNGQCKLPYQAGLVPLSYDITFSWQKFQISQLIPYGRRQISSLRNLLSWIWICLDTSFVFCLGVMIW